VAVDELDELDLGVEEADASVVAVVDEVAPDADEVDRVEEVDRVDADLLAVDVAVTEDEVAAVEVWWEVVLWAARAAMLPTPRVDTPATTLVARRLRRSHLSRRRGELMPPFMPPESGSRLYGTLGPEHSLSLTLGPRCWANGAARCSVPGQPRDRVRSRRRLHQRCPCRMSGA
jgi:hypothetical protein